MVKSPSIKRGLKRHKSPYNVEIFKKKSAKKSDNQAVQTSSPTSTGRLSLDEEDMYNEALTFDCFLKQLGSGRRRDKQERSNSEEDDGSESEYKSDEEDEGEKVQLVADKS